MQTYYKKLLLLLILLTVLFFLSLAFGSAEDEPCELCQLCRNKALVIRAVNTLGTRDPNLLCEIFAPNYRQDGPDTWKRIYGCSDIDPNDYGFYQGGKGGYWLPGQRSYFEPIAEGNRVAIESCWGSPECLPFYFDEIAVYHIADGKIVRGHVARTYLSGYD